MRLRDQSFPREMAERRIRVTPGTLTLDQLACLISTVWTEDPVSVRDITARPIAHSRVYFRGEATDAVPYLSRQSIR